MKNFKTIIICAAAALVCSVAAAKTIKVADGEDLRAKARKALAGDTVKVEKGSYVLTSALPLAGDLVITADPKARPTVNLTNILVGTAAKSLVIENIDIVFERKYLFYLTGAEDQCSIENITLRNCTINFNGVGASIIGNRSTAATNVIGNFTIDNCVVFGPTLPSHGVLNVGSESTLEMKSLTLTNSTFSNFDRGVVICSKPMDGFKLTVGNCTFYKMNTSDNTAGLFRVDKGSVDAQITKSVFSFTGEATKFLVVGAVDGGKGTVTDSFRTAEQKRVVGELGLQTASGKADEVFTAPGDNPTAAGVSFKIKDAKFAGQKIGDPRWF